MKKFLLINILILCFSFSFAQKIEKHKLNSKYVATIMCIMSNNVKDNKCERYYKKEYERFFKDVNVVTPEKMLEFLEIYFKIGHYDNHKDAIEDGACIFIELNIDEPNYPKKYHCLLIVGYQKDGEVYIYFDPHIYSNTGLWTAPAKSFDDNNYYYYIKGITQKSMSINY